MVAAYDVAGHDVPVSSGVRTVFGFSRSELFLLVFAVLSANAMWMQLVISVSEFGWMHSIYATFNVSAIVWAGLYVGLAILADAPKTDCRPLDGVVAILALVVALLPIGPATWSVVALVSGYVILTERQNANAAGAGAGATAMSRAAWIFLALTVPLFWGRRLFVFFSDYILSADAYVVSLMTRTERVGNIVAMPDGAGSLIIAAPCSSLANISLAVLCWTIFSQNYKLKWSPLNVYWCLAACMTVAAINIVRIVLIGYFPDYYAFIHDGEGVTIVSWITAIACVIVCRVGVGHVISKNS